MLPNSIILKEDPSISVDCVVFGYDEMRLNALLVKRTLNQSDTSTSTVWTLTGNHIYQKEPLEEAAARVLRDLTGLEDVYLEQFGSFADPDRLKNPKDQEWLRSIDHDPERRVITVGYFALLDSTKVTLEWRGREVEWKPVREVGVLGFDHNHILDKALEALRNKMRHEPIGFELLPEKFTLTQLQNLYEQIFDTRFDKRNFRKKVARMKYVIPLDEKQVGVPHKPAQLFVFSREVYEKTRTELFDFIV